MSRPTSGQTFSTEKVDPAAETSAPVLSNDTTSATTDKRKSWTPSALGWKSTVFLCLILIGYAIGLEIALHESRKYQGFVGLKISATETVQFLKSFVPALLFLPILAWVRKVHLEMKVLQPYIDLSRGHASAEHSITLEYMSLGPTDTFWRSLTLRHAVLAIASAITVMSAIFEPLAGALFTVKLVEKSETVFVERVGILAVNPALNDTGTPFIAASGFLTASIYTGGSLPPFVTFDNDTSTGYMVPPFNVSDDFIIHSDGIATLQIQTEVLQFSIDCAPATNATMVSSEGTYGSWDSTISLGSDCSVTATGNINQGFTSFIGGAITAGPSCIPAINSSAPAFSDPTNVTLPIALGFWANGTIASGAFCYSYQEVYSATVEYDIKGNKLASISDLVHIPNHPLEGYSQTGLDFGETGEAVAIGLANGVITKAGKPTPRSLGIDTTLQNEILSKSDATLATLCQFAFGEFVMVASTGNLVAEASSITDDGTLTIERARVFGYAPAVHTLAILCLATAFVLGCLFIVHDHQRRDILLADRPGTVGVIGALLSKTPVIEQLEPHLTNKDIEKRLSGYTFGMNQESGAIVATPPAGR